MKKINLYAAIKDPDKIGSVLYIFDGVFTSLHRCSYKQAADMLPSYLEAFGYSQGIVMDNDTCETIADCEIR